MNFGPRLHARAPLLALALLAGISTVSAACGRHHRGGLPVINSFTATPVSLPSNGGSVTFQWNVSGASDLSISPVVGAVTGTATTAIITQDGNYTLTATNARGSTSSSIHIAVGAPMTVHGIVSFGAPIAGASVVVLGQASHGVHPAQTDTNGAFTIDGVVPPYDIAVTAPLTGPAWFVFRGLNRPDPRLIAPPFGPLWPSNTSFNENVSGTVAAGAGFPLAAGVRDAMEMYSPEGVQRFLDADAASGAWSTGVNWTAKQFTTVTFRALEFTSDPAFPGSAALAFSRYGSKQATITQDGGTFSGINVPLSPVTSSGLVTANYTVPPFYSNPSIGLQVDFGGPVDQQDAIFLPAKTGTNGTMSLHAPSIPGSKISMQTGASGPNGEQCTQFLRGLTPTSTGVAVDVPEAGQLLLPPNNATGVTANTLFAWTRMPQSISGIILLNFSSPIPQVLVIYEADQSGPLPDLREIGFELSPGASYDWATLEFGPAATMDDFTGPLANDPEVRFCSTPSRQFQVHP